MAAGENSSDFQALVLANVKLPEPERELGRGAYGKVYEVNYCETICAAKEIHSLLIEASGKEEKQHIIDTFSRECHQCSRLRHPNIVQFLGVYYPEGGGAVRMRLPVMVMEMMACSLTSLVKEQQKIAVHIKYSIINDVALGLCYLHSHNPPIVHRDLSPNNILLTAHLVAKISDLGVAKAMPADSKKTMTQVPGTCDFMPREARQDRPKYGPPVDVFSFGGIILHTFTQQWPSPCEDVQFDPESRALVALSEVQRRMKYLDKITDANEVALKPFIVKCLDDDPNERPCAMAACGMIKQHRDALGKDLTPDFITLHNQIQRFQDKIKTQSNEIEQLNNKLRSTNLIISRLRRASEEQLHVNIKRQTSKLQTETFPLVPALCSGRHHIKWTQLADLPVPLSYAYTAVLDDKIYISGHETLVDDAMQQVYVYDTSTDSWDQLPAPNHYYGIPQIIDRRLSIIGGLLSTTNKFTNQITTFDDATQSWNSIYPGMFSARSKPGVITYLEYVFVAGGANDNALLNDIEVLDWVESSHWRKLSLCLPVPMFNIKPTLSDGSLLIVGYYGTNRQCYSGAYKIAITDLISSIEKQTNCNWTKLSSCSSYDATLIPNSSPPLIIGGCNTHFKATADIKMYDVTSKSWKMIGSLSFGRIAAAVAAVGNEAIVVIGGCSDVKHPGKSSIKTVELGQVMVVRDTPV